MLDVRVLARRTGLLVLGAALAAVAADNHYGGSGEQDDGPNGGRGGDGGAGGRGGGGPGGPSIASPGGNAGPPGSAHTPSRLRTTVHAFNESRDQRARRDTFDERLAPESDASDPRRAETRSLLHEVADRAADWLESLPERSIGPAHTPAQLRITEELGDGPLPVDTVIADLVREAAPGLTAINSPRFFGFVMGGAHPAGIAADWLTTAWDQNAGLASPTPAAAAFEAVAGRWLAELFGLPPTASFALVTGCQMAHVTALAAARHRVLARAGHDVEVDGLVGAPRIRVLAGEERHVTVDRALRLLGLGAGCVDPVATDELGALHADRLAGALARGDDRPTIVVAQAGNVNGGAIDPLEEVCAAAHAAGAWVHIDGAFGLWAAASPTRRGLVRGIELADSWATDAHKWLNVPYDCGIAFVADRQAHRAALSVTAAYLVQDRGGPREPMDWTPEFSRRARGLAVYATLRALGRAGVAGLVDRLCACAERFAQRLGDAGFEVLHQELNQVLVACQSDALTDAALAAVQADGTCYPSGTTWRGRRCIRLSVCNWQTTADDIDRSVAAIVESAYAGAEVLNEEAAF